MENIQEEIKQITRQFQWLRYYAGSCTIIILTVAFIFFQRKMKSGHSSMLWEKMRKKN